MSPARALQWGLLLLVAVGLAWVERRVERCEGAERQAAHRIGRLVPRAEREHWEITALEVGRWGEPRLHFAKGDDGVWRCKDRYGAPADGRAIEGLVKALLDAEGVVVTRDPNEARELGIGTPSTWVVVLAGGPGERRIEFRLGLRTVAQRGCYVQRADEDGVWQIDTDPWGPLGLERARGRAPLLDPHLVPAYWPGSTRRIDEIRVERSDGVRYRLTLHDVPISDEEFRQGKSPFEWRLHLEGAESEEGAVERAERAVSYAAALFLARWKNILEPGRSLGIDFSDPAFRVTLVPREGETLELAASSEPLPEGDVAVRCSVSGLVFAVDRPTARLLAPDPDLLRGSEGEDPFAPLLKED